MITAVVFSRFFHLIVIRTRESTRTAQVPPPRQSYSPGGVTIFALPAVRLCPLYRNGNENFKVIHNPGFLPDHAQNWITGSLCHARHTLKISERSVHNFSSYRVDSRTNKQTNKNWQKHYLLGGGNNAFYCIVVYARDIVVTLLIVSINWLTIARYCNTNW